MSKYIHIVIEESQYESKRGCMEYDSKVLCGFRSYENAKRMLSGLVPEGNIVAYAIQAIEIVDMGE